MRSCLQPSFYFFRDRNTQNVKTNVFREISVSSAGLVILADIVKYILFRVVAFPVPPHPFRSEFGNCMGGKTGKSTRFTCTPALSKLPSDRKFQTLHHHTTGEAVESRWMARWARKCSQHTAYTSQFHYLTNSGIMNQLRHHK